MKTKSLLILPLLFFAACSDSVPMAKQPDLLPTPAPLQELQETPPASFSALPADIMPPAPKPIPVEPESYFLMVRKSIQTPDGIEGVMPATQIQKMAEGQYSYNGNVLMLAPAEVTTDRQQAAKVRAQLLYMANKPFGSMAIRVEPVTPTPTPTPRQQSTAQPLGSSLDKGAYNKREGVARPPVLLKR